MKIEDQLPLLKKLMAFKTPEQQQAFLEGLEYHIPTTPNTSECSNNTRVSDDTPLLSTSTPSPRRVRARGLRAKVLRLLYTGPCRETELANHCKPEEVHALRATLRRLEQGGKIAEAQGMFVLTTSGRPEARFFMENPTSIIIGANYLTHQKGA